MVHFCSLPLISDARQFFFHDPFTILLMPSAQQLLHPAKRSRIPFRLFLCSQALQGAGPRFLHPLLCSRIHSFSGGPCHNFIGAFQQQLHFNKALSHTISTALVFSDTARCRSSNCTSSLSLKKYKFSGKPCRNFIDAFCPTTASSH